MFYPEVTCLKTKKAGINIGFLITENRAMRLLSANTN